MSVPLRPQQSFTVVRQIANHLDSGTYYVRAVIRNAYTDDIIATLDLTDRGGQRFSKNWRTPADKSGQGFYISIVTSVYTDSGYTTKSSDYGDEENTHLIEDKRLGGGGGGGANIDYTRIRQMLKEEIEKAKTEPVEIPEAPAMRWEEVLSALATLQTAVSAIPTEKVDTSPILTAIKGVQEAIDDKEVTPATDLTPVLEKLETLAPELQTGMRNLITLLDDAQGRFSEEAVKEIARIFSETEFSIAPSTAKMSVPKPAKKEEEGEPFDLSALAT